MQAAYSAVMGNLPYPLLSDFWPHGEMAKAYGILNDETGLCRRTVMVVDKQGVIRFKRIYQSAGDIEIDEILAEVDKLG